MADMAKKENMKKTADIIMYYGAECPHCHAMMPLVAKLEKEAKIKIEKKEVWHNEENADEMRSHEDIISHSCGGEMGVPCFFSKKKKQALCGETPYREFKEWAVKNR